MPSSSCLILQATFPAELQHGAELVVGGTGDGAARHQVARVCVATRDGVVRQLLLHRPVHVLEVGFADCGEERDLFRFSSVLKPSVIQD
jgi:hypothetical protein